MDSDNIKLLYLIYCTDLLMSIVITQPFSQSFSSVDFSEALGEEPASTFLSQFIEKGKAQF